MQMQLGGLLDMFGDHHAGLVPSVKQPVQTSKYCLALPALPEVEDMSGSLRAAFRLVACDEESSALGGPFALLAVTGA